MTAPVDLRRRFEMRARIAFHLCMVFPIVLTPICANAVAWTIICQLQPDSGAWFIPYLILASAASVVSALTCGFTSRWTRRFINHSILIPVLGVLLSTAFPFISIAWLVNPDLSVIAAIALFLFWSNALPFFVGMLVYYLCMFFNPPDHDGQWTASGYD
ncbi:MAG: hypothetical protein ABL921_01435 [Pirellula sp.]